MPKAHHIGDFWTSVSDSQYTPFTEAEIELLRTTFGVVGRVKGVDKAPGYAVSDCGRVFSRIPCSWKQGEMFREMKAGHIRTGHRIVRLHVNKRPSTDMVHRLVAFAFLPPPTEGQTVVRHLDGDPTNNMVDNLAWGTQADNMADCIRHGRTLKGMKNPNAKMTPRRAELAKGLKEEGFSSRAIAAFFGVDRETIRRAVNG